MQLICPDCNCRFSAPAETTEDEIMRRMTEEGPWYALGAGHCFCDMIHTALEQRGRIVCPECGALVRVRIVGVAGAIELPALLDRYDIYLLASGKIADNSAVGRSMELRGSVAPSGRMDFS